MKNTRNTLLIIFFATLSLSGFSQENLTTNSTEEDSKLENALIYKFYRKGKQDTSYLFGTIHIPVKKAFYAVDTVKSLIQKVDKVFFEIAFEPEDLMSKMQLLLAKDSLDKVKNILSKEDYKRLKDKADELFGPIASKGIDVLKPFGIISMFTNSIIPSDTTFAMDIAFQQYAKNLGKEVGGLETIEEQLGVFDSISQENKKAALLDIIDDFKEEGSEFDKLLAAYLAKDLNRIKVLSDSAFSDTKYLNEEDLLLKRNRKMAKTIHSIAYYNTAVIGVGAAHLVGEEGLLSLLRKQGYTLEAIK